MEENLPSLNNIITSKKHNDELLEQQILQNEEFLNKPQKSNTSNSKPKKRSLNEALDRTKDALQEITSKLNSEMNTPNHGAELVPKKLDYYSLDVEENEKSNNANNKNRKNSNNLANMSNESIIIKETNEGDDEKFAIEKSKNTKKNINNINTENDMQPNTKKNKTKIRIITSKNSLKNNNNNDKNNFVSNNNFNNNDIPMKKNNNINDQKLKNENEKNNIEKIPSSFPNTKPVQKKFQKNSSVNKITFKFSDDEDFDLNPTTSNSKKLKQKKIKKQNSQIQMHRSNTTMNESSNIDKFTETYERFKENQQKKKQKLEELKKIKEQKEKRICTNKPKINKKSIAMTKNCHDDFYTRQKKLSELKMKNEQLLKERLNKKEEEDFNKNNTAKNKLPSRNKPNKKEISNSINKLYEWDKNRKEKIKNLQKNLAEETSKENYNVPKIDKTSYKITVNLKYTKRSTVKRLYIDDIKKREERMRALNEVYRCCFTPNANARNKSKSKYNIRTKSKNMMRSSSARITHVPTNSCEYTQSDFMLNDDVENMMRMRVIGKLFKKGKRNNSAVNIFEKKNSNPNLKEEEIEEKEEEDINSNKNGIKIGNMSKEKEGNGEYFSNDDIKIKKFKKVRYQSVE